MKEKSKKNLEKEATIIGTQVQDREITQEMEESYLAYAMSVIVSRALPDVRDGLKPVHRRILHTMNELGLKPNTKFVKSARIVGECFVQNTLVSTSKGLKPIQDIQVDDLVFTHTGLRSVTNLYVMPPKPLVRISLSNGISLTSTLSQKLKVFNKDGTFSWKNAEDLTNQDWLTLKTSYPDELPLVKLSEFNGKQKYLNQNIAYIFGLLISDGWITRDYGRAKHRRLGFCSNEISILERIVSCFKSEFEYEPTITSKSYTVKLANGQIKNNQIFRVRINRKGINDFLIKELDIPEEFKAKSKFIPEKFFSSPAEVIYSLISGLMDGDGSISKKERAIIYVSISEKLINQLQILLQSLGMFSQRYALNKTKENLRTININGKERIFKEGHVAHTLEWNGWEAYKLGSELNLASKRKTARLLKILSHNPNRTWSEFGTLPYGSEIIFNELSKLHIGSGWYKSVDGQKFRMGIHYAGGGKLRYSNDLTSKNLTLRQVEKFGILKKFQKLESKIGTLIREIVDNDINFLKVAKVETAVAEETYDIEVAGDHEFVANGVLSHNCMGKFHPHGDVAIYDSLVRMVQDFSLRYPLVRGQGNFGSVDGDRASAMRYSEAKLAPIAEEILADIDKDTVDFRDNYDSTQKEPIVLPTKIPSLLINGSMGIAVGMATNIPPHNLTEVLDGLVHLIDNPEADVADLNQFVKGPDFPTAGIIYNEKDILNAYATGKGPIIMRAKADIVEGKKGFQIIVSEIPYQVNKAELIAKIAELAMGKERKVDGIRDVRDESDREGVRVVVDLKQDAFPKKVLNQLFKYTELQKTFHINMLALVDGIQPQILGLKGVLEHFIEHRRVVVIRRAKFDLKKTQDRAHILEGLKKALDHIDVIIKLIRASASQEEALKNLMKKFSFSQLQATAILEMKLRALAGLERKKVEEELAEKKKLIAELEALLASPKKILALVKQELLEVKEKYGDERRTKIVKSALKEVGEEELMPEEDSLFMVTRGGYLKRMAPDVLKVQKRGGKGLIGIETKEEDIVSQFFMANTHDTILFFTNSGRAFQVKGYEVPESSRTSKGKAIVNFLNISPTESVTAVVPIAKDRKGMYLFMATKNGVVKKVALTDFQKVRSNGLAAIKLKKDDELKWVWGTSGKDQIMMISSDGSSIRFKESDVRPMGRVASGVIGMRLDKDAKIVGMEVVSADVPEKDFKLLVVMDKGYGKRTDLRYYKVQHRGGRGIMTAKITTKTGQIISAHLVNPEDMEIIAVSQKGQVIRTELGSISVLGRATQGVRIMRMSTGDSVASVVVV